MARITVEDCIDKFDSRFELVLVASNRARKLHSGESPTVEKDNDKPTVIALREIADESLSIDSLKAERFKEITLRDDMKKVITGIEASIEAGLSPVKINVVVMRGINDDEIIEFAKFGRERGVIVRFIEFMPLDADEKWSTLSVVSLEEIFSTINSVYPLAVSYTHLTLPTILLV